MTMKRFVIPVLLLVSYVLVAGAQDATEEATPEATLMAADSLELVASAWEVSTLEEAATDEPPQDVIFLELDDGETLIEVTDGPDIVYTRTDDTTYAGSLLVPTDSYGFEATLTLIDDDTREITSATETSYSTYESNFRYVRTDREYGVWVEGERTLEEYSLFAECLGRTDVSPPDAWVTPDPILPIALQDDEAVLLLGDTELSGTGGTYIYEEAGTFGQFPAVTTQTATVADNVITFDYYRIADERDDCELRYTTTYYPFNGDYELLFSRADSLSDRDDSGGGS